MAHQTRPPSEPADAPRDSERAPAPARSARVLIVDDDAGIGALIRRSLGSSYSVEFFTDARVALARIRDGERFDAILSDVTMPEMSGVDFHRALVAESPDQFARVIFITGGALTPEAQQYLEQSSAPVVEKPFEMPRLRSVVRDMCRR